MSGALRFLTQDDVRALGITPAEARQAVLDAVRARADGQADSAPKTSLPLAPGHAFQAMIAASAAAGIAAVKWTGVAPVPPGAQGTGVNSVIVVSDYPTGEPLAVMDGNEITLLRTAALSALAGSWMAPPGARTIGMVGCGLQAHAHLAAFADLLPDLERCLAFSRSRESAGRLASAAEGHGLAGEVVDAPEDLLRRCDVVVSMVPAAPGLKPFLDARLLKPEAFVSAVDLGRSWLPESFAGFSLLVTDDLAQGTHPWDADGGEVGGASFSTDLTGMCRGPAGPDMHGRRLFCFKGTALADLALSALVMKRADLVSPAGSGPRSGDGA